MYIEWGINMFKGRNRIIFMVIFLLLGTLISVQIKSTITAKMKKEEAVLDAEELIKRIENEEKIKKQLMAEIDNYNNNYDVLVKNCYKLSSDTSIGLIKDELDLVKFKSGMVPVKGQGIVIKLDDAEAGKDVDPNILIIHDQDLRIILNELKKGGAQAISINGERIMPMSEQVCAGPTILINKNRYTAPYIIKAIGDPDNLYKVMINCNRLGLMIRDKIKVKIDKSDEITIELFKGINEIDKLISGMEVLDNEN